MGGDCINYANEYKSYHLNENFSFRALCSYNERQPGWVFICKLCRLITPNFYFFKFVHAIFYNILIFIFIKRIAFYRFTALLFYFVLIYFDTNFQILRQSLAIGFFLLGIPYYQEKKWAKYYLCIFAAFLFHDSALLCFLFPLVRYIKMNRIVVVLSFITILLMIYYKEVLLSFIISIIPSSFENKAFVYVNQIDEQGPVSLFLNLVLSIIIPLIYIYRQKMKGDETIQKGAICYGFLYTINLFFPIFYRFGYYFIFFFYLLYIEMLYKLARNLVCKKNKVRISSNLKGVGYGAYTLFFLLLFLSFKSRMYFVEYADTGMPTWVQYYPYSSILLKDTDPTRERFIRKLSDF